MVKASLLTPSTAKFSESGEDAGARELGQGIWEAHGWVDSQNAFGAMLRQDWHLIWRQNPQQTLYYSLNGKPVLGNLESALAKAQNR